MSVFRLSTADARHGFAEWLSVNPISIQDPKSRSFLVAVVLVSITVRLGVAADRLASDPPAAVSRGDLILVIGAAGEAAFGEQFQRWAERWEQGASQGGLQTLVIGRDKSTSIDRDQLREAIAKAADGSPAPSGPAESKEQSSVPASLHPSAVPLWLVMIGHGTFDGRNAKFNLRGDDVSAEELREWLAKVKRPLAIVTSFSASAPFLDALSAPERVIISATKSGAEVNFSRFGGYFCDAVVSRHYDLDKDNQVSLLEAFLAAARKTQEFYDSEGRLATEHPLLDDNGDGLGTRAEAYKGLRLAEKDDSIAWDGLRAHQWHLVPSSDERRLAPELARRRDALELLIAQLRERKPMMLEDVYYAELEKLLVEMAGIYATLDAPADAEDSKPGSSAGF